MNGKSKGARNGCRLVLFIVIRGNTGGSVPKEHTFKHKAQQLIHPKDLVKSKG